MINIVITKIHIQCDHSWRGSTWEVQNLVQNPKKDMAMLSFDYLLYLYTYSECHKSLYISEGMVSVILSSRHELVTVIE